MVHSSASLLALSFSFFTLRELRSLRGIGDCQWAVMTEMEGLETFSEVSECMRCNYYVMSWNVNSSQHIRPKEFGPQGRSSALCSNDSTITRNILRIRVSLEIVFKPTVHSFELS